MHGPPSTPYGNECSKLSRLPAQGLRGATLWREEEEEQPPPPLLPQASAANVDGEGTARGEQEEIANVVGAISSCVYR